MPPELPPKVTIAIPTLSRAEYLRLAVESALMQSYSNIEVVVSNNASTDETASWLASYTDPRLRVLTQETRLSMAENWNACLHAASGKYFLLLSDDDLLEPDAIRELVGGYKSEEGQPEPAIVYSGGSFINSNGDVTVLFRHSPLLESARELILAHMGGKRDLYLCALLQRIEDVLPGYPTNYYVACDGAVWMKTLIRRGPAVFIPKQLVRYRQHPSLSRTTPLDTWLHDHRLLHALIKEEDERAGQPDKEFSRSLDSAMQSAELRTIIGWINHSPNRSKVRALFEYLRNLPTFMRRSGPYFLVKGIVVLFLSDKSRLWLRKRLRKQPVIAT